MQITYIGKEIDKLEEAEHLGVWDDVYQKYMDDLTETKYQGIKKFIL